MAMAKTRHPKACLWKEAYRKHLTQASDAYASHQAWADNPPMIKMGEDGDQGQGNQGITAQEVDSRGHSPQIASPIDAKGGD